jgi:glycolate oxidase iron-sulfur subunit
MTERTEGMAGVGAPASRATLGRGGAAPEEAQAERTWGTSLGLDSDDLASCVACGLCLPHCPTWRVSGDEVLSPRGRIAAMRLVEAGDCDADDPGFLRSIDTCVQCRGCEPACPSAVPFGRLMSHTRAAVARSARPIPRWQRLAYEVLRHHRLLLGGSSALALLQRARLLPGRLSRRLGLPARLPVRRSPLVPTGDDVWLFTGCVMDAWQRHVHRAVVDVLTAAGVGVRLPGLGAACCGALHEHAGLDEAARRLAVRTIAALPGEAPVLVDSAGCGAALAGYGELLDTDPAHRFSARVRDVHGWLAERLDDLPPRRNLGLRVAVHDPCHLRHVQRDHMAVRPLLAEVADVVELDDEGLCCGAGGAYAALQPTLAAEIRDRKLAAISRTGADVVASANPGCTVHLAAGGVEVRHPMELLAASLSLSDHGHYGDRPWLGSSTRSGAASRP